MARIKKKVTKIKKESPKTSVARAPRDPERPSWRLLETIGIVTLASALLIGPSLASVQFGEGRLMGPFGELVGRALNYLLGLSGYWVVAGLVLVSLRIFAGALGRGGDQGATFARWRRRLGALQAALLLAVLLHLVFRPEQLGNASYGGVVGEVLGEVLCALLSTPGAWLVCLAGLALSLVLATRFSWAHGAIWLWYRARGWLGGLGGATARLRHRAAAFGNYVARQLAQARKESVSADGTAAMPPVVRLDLGPEEPERERPRRGAGPMIADKMPADLEIGKQAEPPPPVISLLEPADDEPALEGDNQAGEIKKIKDSKGAKGARAQRPAEAPTSEVVERLAAELKAAAAAPAGDDPVDTAAAKADAAERAPRASKGGDAGQRRSEGDGDELTIVESKFESAGGENQSVEIDEEKRVEQTDGPGFVLNHETYRHPPLTILENHERGQAPVDREAIHAQAKLLVKTLADYKIIGQVKKVHPGPVVTMYEFVPAPGTRISKVANLANDLAMSLKAQRVRIVAPIPGKGAIGIEVPNESREAVSFKKIVADEAFRDPKSTLTLAIGKNIFGAPVTMDLAKMPHLLVAGATGAGKSVSINSMICSLLLKRTPEEVRMIMVDPKFLELSGYNDIPHLLLPVVTDPKKANIALRWAVAEMERRYQMLAEMRVRDIGAYNRKVAKLRGEAEAEDKASSAPETIETMREARPSKVLVVRKRADGTEESLAGSAPDEAEAPAGQDTAVEADAGSEGEPAPARATKRREDKHKDLRRLPYIVVIIDEFADLMMCAPKEVEQSVARLAQKARAAGIHLIVATQRPSVDVITGLIKANFPSRMAFQVASNHDSKTILGCQGAENLLGAGDMLVLDRGTAMKRIHGAYISDEEIRGVVDWLRDQGRPLYDMEILKPPEDDEEQAGEEQDDLRDELYDRAVQIVAESQQVSISMIQRRLRIGYNRSARIVERMEREGVVSAPDGPRGRSVLIKQI